MSKRFKDFTYKANRFIDSLAKRGDEKLNAFFIELAESIQSLSKESLEVQEDFGLHEFEKDRLRQENEKLKKALDLFCNIRIDELSNLDIAYLHRMRKGNYYTARSFFQDFNMIKENDQLMEILYPDVDRKPKSREELKTANKYLNDKLCKMD
jgi:uncharacterized protein (UPF0305 family)